MRKSSGSSLRGLSLAETIVAGVIALLLGLLMVSLLSSGLGAHSKGSQSRDAQAGVRNLTALLVAELRSAVPPPLAPPLVVTPVFWPGVWGAAQELNSSSDTGFYARTTEAKDDYETDSALNRLLYVRAREDQPPPESGPLARFALVELFVPEERPNQVERRVHQLSGLSSAFKKSLVQGADDTTREAWLLDLDLLRAEGKPSVPDVVFDAGPEARVAFEVSHRTFSPPSDPGRTRFPQLFDPGVFKVTVAVALKPLSAGAQAQPWPAQETFSTYRDETTELRIPAVRQN